VGEIGRVQKEPHSDEIKNDFLFKPTVDLIEKSRFVDCGAYFVVIMFYVVMFVKQIYYTNGERKKM